MAFYKKIMYAINKKWYLRSSLIGTPVSTEQVATRLATESTVVPADVLSLRTDALRTIIKN